MSLEVSGLRVEAGSRVMIDALSFTLAPGRVVAVLGANGAGKSELVMALAGMLRPVAGSVVLEGKDITGAHPAVIRRAGLAAVPEGHRILTQLTVDDNLRAAGSILPRGVNEALDETYHLFPELAERRDQIAGTMSGGQQQMLALGHAMMARPRYLLIDEMSLGLAPVVVKRLMGFVADLAARGTAVLLIEQFADLALSIAHDAIVLRGGRERYAGPASGLRGNAARLNEAYFGL
jgi:branched-chain amino acid transport system ATP-binding protein